MMINIKVVVEDGSKNLNEENTDLLKFIVDKNSQNLQQKNCEVNSKFDWQKNLSKPPSRIIEGENRNAQAFSLKKYTEDENKYIGRKNLLAWLEAQGEKLSNKKIENLKVCRSQVIEGRFLLGI